MDTETGGGEGERARKANGGEKQCFILERVFAKNQSDLTEYPSKGKRRMSFGRYCSEVIPRRSNNHGMVASNELAWQIETTASTATAHASSRHDAFD